MGRRSRDRCATPRGGRGAPPIPLLRPFDPAQGERNTLHPGMERPYFVSRFRGANHSFAKDTPRRVFDPSPLTPWHIYGPSRDRCVTAYHTCDAIQITLHPSPRSYFDGAQHERPRPSTRGYAKVTPRGTCDLSRGKGLDLLPIPLGQWLCDGLPRGRPIGCLR